MARLSEDNVRLAREIIGRYPKARSATIPLLHLAQEQNGYVTNEAMSHIGELVGATSAEVYGTASFYEMFKFEPVGKYLINICGTLSCALLGAEELMHHAEDRLGIKMGSTTSDGKFTLERVECQAACTEAPCLQVNYRYRYRVTATELDSLIDDLSSGALDSEVPTHGIISTVRQHISADRGVGAIAPELVTEGPAWLNGKAAL